MDNERPRMAVLRNVHPDTAEKLSDSKGEGIDEQYQVLCGG